MKQPDLKIQLGKDEKGEYFSYDLSFMPHLLIGGVTGSGKSQFIHNAIWQLIENNSSDEIKLIMSDCNRVELVHYSNIPYMYAPVLTEGQSGVGMFEWLDYELERRYDLLRESRVRTTDDYNEKHGKYILPKIIVIIDELANLSEDYPKIERGIIRIAQLAKYSGIHMIIATQSCNKSIVTGLIKANIPSRIAFKTKDEESSRVIIDQSGAEKLSGKGDMLFVPPTSVKPIRLQGDYIPDQEIIDKIAELDAVTPNYHEVLLYATRRNNYDISENELNDAIKLAKKEGEIKTSTLQRGLSLGYAKSARIIDLMEEKGIISKMDPHTKTRKFLKEM